MLDPSLPSIDISYLTLNQVLEILSLHKRPAKGPYRYDILDTDDHLLFNGNAGEVFDWILSPGRYPVEYDR